MRLCLGLTLATIGLCGTVARSEPASPQANESLTVEDARAAALQVCGQRTNDLNACVVATTRLVFADRRNKGYNTQGFFTKALDYGPKASAIISSAYKPETMCVAAASEMTIETLNFYFKATNDHRPFDIITADSWNNSRPYDIRSYMWENEGPENARGAGTSFATFGAGEIVDFNQAKPGDFLSLDREKFRPVETWLDSERDAFSKKKILEHEGHRGVWQTSGHSTVFLGYLDRDLKWTDRYADGKIVGFLYFSSQGGHGSAGGFNYRWAIFQDAKDNTNSPICTKLPELSARLDCNLGGIVRQVRVGRLWHPSRWDDSAPGRLHDQVETRIQEFDPAFGRRGSQHPVP